MTEPDCACWQDPQQRLAREAEVHAVCSEICIEFSDVVRDTSLCPEAWVYTAIFAAGGLLGGAYLMKLQYESNEKSDDSDDQIRMRACELALADVASGRLVMVMTEVIQKAMARMAKGRMQ